MLQVTDIEIKNRLAFDNPWWGEGMVPAKYRDWPRRAYFDEFVRLVRLTEVSRAVVLMGPRRVGKSVMLHQCIQELLASGVEPRSILYVSLDTPTYVGLGLEQLLQLFLEEPGRQPHGLHVFFDEIQYLKNWEVHLKSLVDSYPGVRTVVSGSAAAALRLRSNESGAGRFTHFMLPPLLFGEYLQFAQIADPERATGFFPRPDGIRALNGHFIDYINFGGFPEAVRSVATRDQFQRFIGSDILDKVLLRDLPSLYGVSDTQELNRLFAMLAYNTGGEINLDELSKRSGVSKNTLRRYIEYLQAAFLIRCVPRMDDSARRFQRARSFKVYLTNPCLRAALFGPIGENDEATGRLVETAVFCQWLHTADAQNEIFFARWPGGEVDFVFQRPGTPRPLTAIEVKWSDRALTHRDELQGLLHFADRARPSAMALLTRTAVTRIALEDREIVVVPASAYCVWLGGLVPIPRPPDEDGLRRLASILTDVTGSAA